MSENQLRKPLISLFFAVVLTAGILVAPAASADDPEPGQITGLIGFTPELVGEAEAQVTVWDVTGYLGGYPASGGIQIRNSTMDLEDGRFVIEDLAPGSYIVRVSAISEAGNWAPMYVGSVPLRSQTTVVTVGAAEVKDVGTIEIHRAGTVHGVIQSSAAAISVAHFYLRNDDTGEFEWVGLVNTDLPGAFSQPWLAAGAYRIKMEPANYDLASRWWPNGRTVKEGEDIVVEPGGDVEFSGALSTPRFPLAVAPRLAGADRYATNVAILREQFPPTGGPYELPVLYIVSGERFPDALVAGPAAFKQGGGVVLTRQGTIPATTWAEINRLNPARIVVLGGEPSVSAAVATRLGSVAEVERIAGANRYETSRLVATSVFGCGSSPCIDRVFIATGRDYPDALSAAGPAAKLGAPIILVDGKATALDPASRELIYDLSMWGVYIMGESNSVSEGIAADTLGLPDAYMRIAGPNRYATSLSAASRFFDPSDDILLTSGLGFADALSGGPLAAAQGAPLILTRPDCVVIWFPPLLLQLDVSQVRYLGASNSVNDGVHETVCS